MATATDRAAWIDERLSRQAHRGSLPPLLPHRPEGPVRLRMTALLAIVLAAALLGSLAAGRRAPRGPLHVCACGHRMRQQGTETRLDFYARQDTHFAACPVLAHLDALED